MASFISQAIRFAIFTICSIYIFTIPNEDIMSGRILRTLQISEASKVGHNIAISDFITTFFIGLLASHALFWPCISRAKSDWPKWGDATLRSIDYFWYIGAAIGLIYIAAAAQFEIVESQISPLRIRLDSLRDSRIEQIKEAFYTCEKQNRYLEEGNSKQYELAIKFINNICLRATEYGAIKDKILFSFQEIILENCDKFPIDYYPPSEGPSYDQVIWETEGLYNALTSLTGVCYIEHHINETLKKIDALSPYASSTTFSQKNRLKSGYIYIFSILLAFRLARTTAEFSEAIRLAARRKAR